MSYVQRTVPVVDKADAVRKSVVTVLEIIDSLAHVEAEQEATGKKLELDGGVRSAVDGTIIKACLRLDALLDESTNWDTKAQDNFFKELSKTQREQQRLFRTQRAVGEALFRQQKKNNNDKK